MYAAVARHIRRLWNQGTLGKVLAVLAFVGASVGIGATRTFAARGAVHAVTGCGLDEKGTEARAAAILTALEAHFGPAKPAGQGSSRRAFPGFDIDPVFMFDPCRGFFVLRVPIATLATMPPILPDTMMKALKDRALGGRYEKNPGSFFAYEAETTTSRTRTPPRSSRPWRRS